jgi:hypothetical protein
LVTRPATLHRYSDVFCWHYGENSADKLIHFDAATTLNVDANALETLDIDAALLLARILNYQEKS